ncbi:MAG: TolC family protein [Pseudomonadota bacterium]
MSLKPFPSMAVCAALVFTAGLSAQATDAAEIDSHQLLKSTQQHLSNSSATLPSVSNFSSRRWLADEPTLSIMRWQSNDNQTGTDETEVTLDLTILTPTQRQLIGRFDTLSARLKETEQRQFQLHISAFLRDHFWRANRARLRLQFYQDVIDQLQQLEQQIEQRYQARNATDFDRILIQQRLITYQTKVQQQQLMLQALTQQWQRVTGQSELPATLSEPEKKSMQLTQHPVLMQLQLQWQIALAAAKNEAEKSQNWALSAGFKKTETSNLSDNQVGLGVSIPLSLSGSLSAVSYQSLQSQRQQTLTALQQQQLTLQLRVQNQISRVQQARQQVKLTQQNKKLSTQAISQLQQLYKAQQINTRRFVDRLIEQWQYRHQYQIAEIELQFARAQLNQAKGIIL